MLLGILGMPQLDARGQLRRGWTTACEGSMRWGCYVSLIVVGVLHGGPGTQLQSLLGLGGREDMRRAERINAGTRRPQAGRNAIPNMRPADTLNCLSFLRLMI